MDRVNLAIVGCGDISQLNAPGYLNHEKCNVYALCDSNPQKANMRAKQWGISPKIFSDYEDVLNDSNIDAVELLTPTYMHPNQIIDGLNAGKHVSCQKPIASTLVEVQDIQKAVETSSSKFRITENFIFYPPLIKAKELLDSGAIGDPSMIRIRTLRAGGKMPESSSTIDFSQMNDPHSDSLIWREDPKLHAGGNVYDDGWHKFATAIWWIGEIDQMYSFLTKNSSHLDESPAVISWKFKNRNCLGVLDYAYAEGMKIRSKYYPVDEFFEIQGSKGAIFVTRCSGEMLDLPPVILQTGSDTHSIEVPMDWIEGFNGAARHFIDAILDDAQPQMDIHFSKHTLQAALSAYISFEKQMPVNPIELI